MRQLVFQVPRGQGARVLGEAKAQEGRNLAILEAAGADGEADLVFVHVSNNRVEQLLGRLEDIPQLQVTLIPQGLLVLRPPPAETPQQAIEVTFRSPVEIFLAGLQSVGAWTGFLAYAAASGIVAWVGLFTETVFLLVAAMLIAPFAGPAMNLALATARGDLEILGRSAARYFTSLSVAVAVAWLMSWLLGPQVATEQMVQISLVSSLAVVLPLVAGAAGALYLAQSERSSLVSGAATGVLIAASLSPPAAVIGMAAALGRWNMVQSGLFLLLLHLVGINLSGALVFRWAGLSPRGVRYRRGRRWLSWTAWGLSLVLLACLLVWQFWSRPSLQHSTIAQRATAVVRNAVDTSGQARLVQADLRFTRAELPGEDVLLAVVYVQRRPQAPAGDAELKEQLTRTIRAELESQQFQIHPLVHVAVLEP